LIDANNLCFREFFSSKNLAYKGKAVDVLYGVFKSLIAYHKKWPNHFRIVCWEGGYARRLAESEAAVEAGLIPSSYKQNRRDKAADPDPKHDIESLFEQMGILETLLDETKTLQVRAKGYEADDVICSYAKWAERHGGDAVIVSSDKDFYQCISPDVQVFDAGKNELWTNDRFQREMGYEPVLWIDKGAIEGEIGPSKDNIFGVTGWGPVYASRYVSQYGDIESIRDALLAKKKRGKLEDVFLKEGERLRLAKSLKRMDEVPNLPRARTLKVTTEKEVKNMFLKWGFSSLLRDAWRLV
jgi:DNA polymerase-1